MHKSSVYKRCEQITDLQSQTAGESRMLWKSFTTSYPWREPESAQCHRAIWSPVGAYTPTQQHKGTGQKHKHWESDSSILLNIALGVGCICNTKPFKIIFAPIPYGISGDSHTHLCLFIPDARMHTHWYIFNML